MLPHLKTTIPGNRSLELAQKLRAHESRNVTYVSPRFPVFWERAHGVNVWDVDGNQFLDLTSGFGVASLGYTPSSIVEAMQQQADLLYHAMGDVHPTAHKAELCARLSELTFEQWQASPGKTILTNSGSEAVEAALKTAWLATDKRGVVAFAGGYHGLGYGALTVTGRPLFRKPFEEQLADFATFLEFPDIHKFEVHEDPPTSQHATVELLNERTSWIEQLRAVMESRPIGAILVEPIQGRGGEIVPAPWLLPSLRLIADEFGAVLIFDEIYTGFYRTGTRFACDSERVIPDLICLGKSLTSGFPLAACVGRSDLMDRAWPESTGEALHTSTFLGNPLGCRMALESLRILESEPWSERVTQLGTELESGLHQLKQSQPQYWGQIRGRGLMRGIEVVTPEGKADAIRAGRLVEALLARGIILLSGGVDQNVLSFTPPFVITSQELNFALKEVAKANSELVGS